MEHPDAVQADDGWQPNLSWLTAMLAVGGSFPPERAEHLAHVLAIRAIVDLRGEACDDPELLAQHGLTFLHLPTPDHNAIRPEMLDAGVAFASAHLARGERVLLHCEHGIGRSALLALCVLVDQGQAPLDALSLAKDRRALVSPSPAQYRAWSHWLASRGIAVPHFDDFKAIAYRHLARPHR